MESSDTSLKVIKFEPNDFDLESLAKRLSEFKSSTSRTSTPVTIEHLKSIGCSETSILLLQVSEVEDKRLVVGMVHLSISYLEDRVHLGPIAVDRNTDTRGHGTPLMEAAIEYVKKHLQGIRRIDLSNRIDHDLASWYKKFGFIPRTEEYDDPSTIYRLPLV